MNSYSLVKVIIIMLCLSGCTSDRDNQEQLINNDDSIFYVVFEDKPDLKQNDIYSNGFKIGKVLSQELNDKNKVIVKITIDRNRSQLIKSNTIFYVSEGLLEYETDDDEGKRIKEGSTLLGFSGKGKMLLHVARLKGGQYIDAVASKGKEIYDSAKQKAGVISEKVKEYFDNAKQ
ncbi:MAG: hypothetical protein OMM_00686 [Candidatus Magnetoglobus multicellularis str. Araruama]|uniref:Uncharacterized protein n=1 Tax=Candidatus Magnetoglobus multicellularis str. Araruama TaxID=890399 RepID=A0A1V1PFU5_9BACT|nr:MAG: hypothetical protein OMM_00686 [Candidatus Magnetoglobus multicellularis str. Araruama]